MHLIKHEIKGEELNYNIKDKKNIMNLKEHTNLYIWAGFMVWRIERDLHKNLSLNLLID